MKNWKYENTNLPGWFYISGVCGEIEGEGKARMLAAAPAMYEALRKAVEWLDTHCADSEYADKEWYHEAKAALRAADGGE